MATVLEDGKVALKEGINIRDLLQGDDVTFSVKNTRDLENEEGMFDCAEDVFDSDSLIANANLETSELDGEHYDTPFENIKAKMAKVTPSGSVMKRVFRQGIGDVIPENAVVWIHYNGYFEFNEIPFDSTTLRGKACKFCLGSGFLPGIDIAVSTMRRAEKSEFLLQPSVAFGKVGCPPRIPGNVEVLFQIEVMRWEIGSEAAVLRAAADEGKVPWETAKDGFKACLKQGIDYYESERYKDCKIKLEKAKQILESCNLKDETEEEEQKKYLFKVCINLAMVFNKMKGHGSYAPNAIINCKQALSYDPHCPKAHLQWGIALTTLGEYEKAMEHLKRVQKVFENNADFKNAWERLQRKMNDDRATEKAMWSKAFATHEKPKEKEEEVSPQVQEIINQLQGFALSDKESMVLPAGVTALEKECIISAAENLNLTADVKTRTIVISKPKK